MKKLSLFMMICGIIGLFLLFSGCSIEPAKDQVPPASEEGPALETLAVSAVYGLYGETVPLSVIWDTDVKLDIWSASGAGLTLTEVTDTCGEGTKSWKLTGTGAWMGMAIRVEPITSLKDMAGYSNGAVNFMYKGTKSIKVGIKSGGVSPNEDWLTMTNGKYGFTNANVWCNVSIPIKFFKSVPLSQLEQYLMVAMDSSLGYTSNTTFYLDKITYTTNSVYAQPTNEAVVTNTSVVSLFSETTPVNVVWDVNVVMENWNGAAITVDTNVYAEGTKSWKFVGAGTWMGVGIRVNPVTAYRNLANFTNGSLKFRFKGTRPVKIGIKSGATDESWLTPAALFRLGMVTNNTWCQVSIPMKLFKEIDFTSISQYFMVSADAATLFSTAASYYIDDLYWTTNASAGGPTNINATSTFGIYSDSVPLDIIWSTSAKMDIWTSSGAGMTVTEDIIDAPEGGKSWKLKGTGSWMGMGIRVEPITTLKNLGAFSNGSLNFMYKGTKSIKIGMKSGGIVPAEKWLVMTNGKYGFTNANVWCSVSIPAGFFREVSFDMTEQYFMVAQDAGLGYTTNTVFGLDNIYFSTNSVYAQPPLPVFNSNVVSLFSETRPINVNWDVNTIMENWNAGTITADTNVYAEGNKSWKFKGTGTWMGFGIRVNPATSYRNLANFTNGSLKFRFKGTRPVKIGIKSGSAIEVWLTPAQLMRLGMATNNSWCQVSVPMTLFKGISFTNISYYFMMSSDAATLFSTAASYYIDDLYWTTNASAGGPTNINAATTYGLFSDTVPLDIVWNTSAKMDIWTTYGAGMTVTEDLIDAPEGGKSWKLKGTGSWMGMGIRVEPLTTLKNMTAYTNGSINFMFKGTKLIKIGVKSGGVVPADKWLVMTNGKYGFTNSNAWCSVSIPIGFFREVSMDMTEQYFMVAMDSALGYTTNTVFGLDNIYYATTSAYAQPPVTAVNSNVVSLFSETTPINVNWDVNTIMENWNAGTITADTNVYAEGNKSWKFKGTGTWMGFGIRVNPATTYRNLTNFAAGSLKFRFKGTRPVKIGIKSGTATEVWLTPAQLMRLGMTTNNSWCQVSVPMTLFKGINFTNISYYFMMSSDAATLFSTAASYYVDDLYWTTNASAGGPTNINATKTYGLYSDTVPLDIVWDTDAKLDIWTDYSAGMTITEDLIDAPEGGKSWKITGTGVWMGMGLRVNPITTLKDMRAYTNGSISFMYKGTRIFKIGVKSGGTKPVEKWLTMTNAKYGFATNNTWCSVTIPLSLFSGVAFGSIEQYFMMVADSALGYTAGSIYRMDNLFWGRP